MKTFRWLRYALVFVEFIAFASEAKKEDEAHPSPPPADAKDATAAKPEEKVPEKSHPSAVPSPSFSPYPRNIHFPRVPIVSLETKNELFYQFSDNRYTFLYVMGTWNPRTLELVKILNAQVPEYRKRFVGLLGVFSHDTSESVKQFVEANKPLFTVTLATAKFIEEFKNPKVPTFWLIDKKGRIVQTLAIPTNQQIEELHQKVLFWTKF